MKRSFLVLFCIFLFLFLCGCGEGAPVELELSSGYVPLDSEAVAAVVVPEDLALLDAFPNLLSADFSGSDCYASLMNWAEAHPQIEVRYTVSFPGDVVAENGAETLDLTGLKDRDADEALELLAYLPQLKEVNLGNQKDGLSPKTVLRFRDEYPDLDFSYQCRLLGKDSDLSEKRIDLSKASPKEIRDALDTIACLRNLKIINLGSEEREDHPSWEDILALEEAVPNVKINYSFSLCGVPLTLQDEEINISYLKVVDRGEEVLAAAKCMPKLKTLLMDSCGVTNEDMAVIRDALPDVEVVWRISFGLSYSVRTNVERILASSPSVGGTVTDSEFNEILKYCTKVKYLDIGHNETITDLSFVNYMPDLEVLIIAMNPLGDLSPLANCEHLEYLELFYSNTSDLSPLAGLKTLKHLNVGHCPYLTDISPIYDLDLDRFYLGIFNFCPVPAEQVDHYRQLHPNCEVDNTAWESSEAGWRRAANLQGEALEWYQQQPYYREDRRAYAPRYALLRDQMEYDSLNYSVRWNDPDYRPVAYNGIYY
ncbi:MAG: hypothetical protein IKS55_04485 [Oscillospiraceae bacterium]|nr:hypothetical protein [Oscillospiraceae bacterium]